ncbi:MAG TPA: RHS repeat-associated core domain-containing protein [Candidatus Limnocylindrales bacterium]|nr:RHS repeat-associated core domain-containing protein [Candidatus Limnocylindrales bacterium]
MARLIPGCWRWEYLAAQANYDAREFARLCNRSTRQMRPQFHTVLRGWLTNKAYADGKGPRYTYTSAGRLASRLWARGTNTVYAYNNAGDLATVTYSDNVTPNLSYAYDRRGRPISIGQGSTTTARAYDDAGNLLGEACTGGPLGGLRITNAFDAVLRRIAVGVSNQPSTLVQYGYDLGGRLSAVTNSNFRASYTYVANSPLVSQISYTYSGVSRMSTTKQYDNLNRLTQISSVPSAGPTASFNYQYNPANQRTAMTNADNSWWSYGYDSLGQVTSGKKYWSDATPVAGEQFEYAFDDIGNRRSTKAGGDQWGANLRYATYSANNLNQYTSRTVPGAADVIGTATNNATVTVNNTRTYRKGSFYQVSLPLNNGSGAVYQAVTNLAVMNNGSNPDILTNANGSIFLPQTPENFSYDLDGNLTQDGRWQYTWDAENRLVTMQALSTVPTAAKFKLDFVYDDQGRRTQKLVSTNNGSGYFAQVTNRFVYDGWNLIANLNPQLSVIRSFAWGLDFSGGLQGAGGVGGLLNINDAASGNHLPCYDGNGNVQQLTKASDGTVSAQYEYGPFGELLRATGPIAKANPFRFCTKYQDDETDLLYYGYRYYNGSTGRWLSKDPLEETESKNLYGFVQNRPVNRFDVLGLYGSGDHTKLTTTAFDSVSGGLGATAKCMGQMKKRLIDANLSQDSVRGNLWQNRRHYNRDWNEAGQAGDTAYGDYLTVERTEFNTRLQTPNKENCKLALEALGRLSHSWQDFFMHAIRRDGKGGKENSSFPGWTAWSVGVTGTPDDRHNFFPSSYDLGGGTEHPPTQEPVLPSSPEWKPRFDGAQTYTTSQLGATLPQWVKVCRCFCE